MPGFDQTGPRGEGPRTGGGCGNCPVDDTNFGNRMAAPRFGVGRGGLPRGGGRGWCFGGRRGRRGGGSFTPPPEPAGESVLHAEIKSLTDEVAALRAELAKLKGMAPDAADA